MKKDNKRFYLYIEVNQNQLFVFASDTGHPGYKLVTLKDMNKECCMSSDIRIQPIKLKINVKDLA
jgi:hypothetical protein